MDLGNKASAFGTLYGVGVGPGDPDLLTLQAVKVLRSVPVILSAASPGKEESLALAVAAPHIPPQTRILRLNFPMTKERTLLERAWENNAVRTAEILQSGQDACFLTLGDPMIYSTFGYLMQTLSRLYPALPVSVVPGVTSFQAAAAKTRTVLCQGRENLLLLSGINSGEDLVKALEHADGAVILKTYRNAPTIRESLIRAGRGPEVVFAAHIGHGGEASGRGLESMPDRPPYLSLLIAPPRR
ncbi:MAG: precorrin-2 C(20)-methyltransferase [Desulfovibrio sp.]|jgi:precorrin-2/cobalt-factor-2 C20-methyltransferase|nr:precorrin-2 C(20)-methyltransferase [Desulfovibrio sp.]